MNKLSILNRFKRLAWVQIFLLTVRGFSREPTILFWAFGFPILNTIVFAMAFSSDSQNDKMIVALSQKNKFSSEFLFEITHEKNMHIIDVPESIDKEISKLSRQSSIGNISELSKSVRDIFTLEKADVILSPTHIYSIRNKNQFKAQEAAILALVAKANKMALPTTHIEVPGMRYSDWFIPGMLGLTILTGGIFGVTFRIVSDREQGLFKRLFLGPFRKIDYFIGFSLARSLFLFWQVAALTFVFSYLFSFKIQGSLLEFFSILFLGGITSSLLGSAIASRTQKTESASGIANFFFFPMMFLSGVYFRTENFPEVIQKISYWFPLTAINTALREIANNATGVMELGPQIGIIVLWLVASLGVTLRFFDWGTET